MTRQFLAKAAPSRWEPAQRPRTPVSARGRGGPADKENGRLLVSAEKTHFGASGFEQKKVLGSVVNTLFPSSARNQSSALKPGMRQQVVNSRPPPA